MRIALDDSQGFTKDYMELHHRQVQGWGCNLISYCHFQSSKTSAGSLVMIKVTMLAQLFKLNNPCLAWKQAIILSKKSN